MALGVSLTVFDVLKLCSCPETVTGRTEMTLQLFRRVKFQMKFFTSGMLARTFVRHIMTSMASTNIGCYLASIDRWFMQSNKMHIKSASETIEMKIILIIFASYTIGFKIYGPIPYGEFEKTPLFDVFCREWLFGITPGQYEIKTM